MTKTLKTLSQLLVVVVISVSITIGLAALLFLPQILRSI
ncbi:hypothetical protein UFOVP562_3 [uncultured Caudovirales phage]|uniref:Uncharacterized protein n=1 Tax=uncultured Caudovirales phage TaxID=2100421 RepID=A0A6J5MYF6_9CAUD|nr:hypothetical protein UFOVP562_3 [uncultured Caudovirales phage]